MKKISLLVVALAAVFALAACSDKVELVKMEATVQEVTEGQVLVETEEGQIWFSYDKTSELEAGDVIEVTYDGVLKESDPMQGTMITYKMITEFVEEPEVMEVVVLEVEESRVLVTSELGPIWFDYEDTSDLSVGDVIKATYGPELMESDPMQGVMHSYEMVTKYVEKFDMTASEILNAVVNGAIENGVEYGGSMEGVIDENNQQWYLGAGDYPEFLDTAVYSPMMNVDVSLIVVLKVELDQVEDLKTTIMESIDPLRMICVTFDLEEDVIVDSYGDTVILVINKLYDEEIHDAFVALQ